MILQQVDRCICMCVWQVFSYTKKKSLQADDLCLDISSSSGPVKLMACHNLGGNQLWEYDRTVCNERVITIIL